MTNFEPNAAMVSGLRRMAEIFADELSQGTCPTAFEFVADYCEQNATDFIRMIHAVLRRPAGEALEDAVRAATREIAFEGVA